jgi:hypothetical protein
MRGLSVPTDPDKLGSGRNYTPTGMHFQSRPGTMAMVDGTKLGELLRNGRGLFLDLDARTPLRALASRRSGRITYVAGDAKDSLGLRAVLVRPDGVVAWAGEATPAEEEAARAASLWFGEPDQVRGPA